MDPSSQVISLEEVTLQVEADMADGTYTLALLENMANTLVNNSNMTIHSFV